MNALERRYAQHLSLLYAAGEILGFYYEVFKVRLARSTFYTPDFLVVRQATEAHVLEFHEVKGWMRDDAAVKLKVAAEMYPEFGFVLARREKGGGWRCRILPSKEE